MMFLAFASVADAQFHHMVSGAAEQRDAVVQQAVDEHELVIDFLIRSEGIDDRQVKLLRIAAKGVGEQRAAGLISDYGGSETVALIQEPGGGFELISSSALFLWDRSLAKVLSEEQLIRFNVAQQHRSIDESATVIDRLDRILYLDSAQRIALQVLIPKTGRKSEQAMVLPAEIGGTNKAKVRKILSAVQMKTWEAIMQGRFDFPPDPFR